jgi:hypothetical protein
VNTDVVTLQQTADDLEAAAELLEVYGHVKGVLADGEGRHCAVGALIEIVLGHGPRLSEYIDLGRNSRLTTALTAVVNELHLFPRSGAWTAVAMWNNRSETTAADVIDAFRHAAKDLRNEAVPA